MTFTAAMADPPANMSLRARLAWKYFFDGRWAVVKTEGGEYICTDEALDLTTATVFPDEESFVIWLGTCASNHLNDDPVSFLRLFTSIPEMINEEVANVILKALE